MKYRNTACIGIIILLVIVTGIVGIKLLLNKQKLYHDTILSESFTCDSSESKEIGLGSDFRIERDRQMLGVRFKYPFDIDIEGEGNIKNVHGKDINIEILLIDSKGEKYPMIFSGARGNKIANYKSNEPLNNEKFYEKIEIKCNPYMEIENIIWTSYDLKDMH